MSETLAAFPVADRPARVASSEALGAAGTVRRLASLALGLVLVVTCAWSQQYIISTYAGGAPLAVPTPPLDASIGAPISVATDEAGNVYFASPDLNCVFKLDPAGVLTRVAGDSRLGYSGDGGPATSARLRLAFGNASAVFAGVAVDRAGNLFIADTGNHRIRRVSPNGIITTVAGNGKQGFSGDGGPAIDAQLNWPWGVAVDGAGNVFIVDTFNYRIRKVSANGIITTFAGGGTLAGPSADGGRATSALLVAWAVAVDNAGNLFIVDNYSNQVLPATPIDGGWIRKVAPSGIITTVAQVGPAFAVAVDGAGTLFIADGNSRVRQVSTNGTISTVVGAGTRGFSGDGGPASNAQVSNPAGVAVDGNGNLFIADRTNYRIRKVSAGGTISTVAGNGAGRSFSGEVGPAFNVADGGPAMLAQLGYPLGVAVDSAGNLFIADTNDNRIRKVSPSGIISTVAGNGTRGFSGDGGPAINAQLFAPAAVALDSASNLFIVDFDNNRIRKVSADGIITTVAGNGTRGFSGDGGPATSAALSLGCDNTICGGLAIDGSGNLFIADAGNSRVRKVSRDGVITTAAGNGSFGFSGDSGPAMNAQLRGPAGLAVDSSGNLLIADSVNSRIRQVSPDGIITTVAGGAGRFGFSGDGGPAISAHLSWPIGVAVDSAGNLFIADPGFNFELGDAGDDPAVDYRVRKVSASGIITTVAGDGHPGFAGDGRPATNAKFNAPTGVAVDGAGNLYVADARNNAVRILRPTNYSSFISAVVDAASQMADPVSPGKIVVIYGTGFGTGTTVSFNGIAAPILYTSATQIAAIVPYAVSGTTAQVTVAYQAQVSNVFEVPVAASAPGIFTLNQAGWGPAAAINAVDGTVNTAVNPVKIGGYISLYATGEGQTGPTTPPRPVLPVSVTVDGIPAAVQYAGGAPGQVAGLMQVNVQIPPGVKPNGYVPVVLQVGDRTSSPAVWIAVSADAVRQ